MISYQIFCENLEVWLKKGFSHEVIIMNVQVEVMQVYFIRKDVSVYLYPWKLISVLWNFEAVESKPSQTSKLEIFAKMVDDSKPLTFFAKTSFLDV